MPENLNDWLGLVVPRGTTNYVTNPSFETDTTGWSTQNATLTRTVGISRFGGYGALMRASAANGQSFMQLPAIGAGTPIVISAWVAANSPLVSLQLQTSTGTIVGQQSHPGDGKYRRISVALSTANASQHYVVFNDANTSGWLDVWIDGVQAEPGTELTSYCDGDQLECRWDGRKHRSISRRPQGANSGGVKKSFRSLGINVRSILGAGAPTMAPTADPYAILPGSEYQQTTINSRTISLTCQAIGTSRDTLHTLRQTLLSALTRQSPSKKPVWLWYKHPDDSTSQIGVYYESGLEFGETVKYMEPFPLRLIAYDPYWQADHDLAVNMKGQELVPGVGVAIRRNEQLRDDLPSSWGWDFLKYTAGDNVSNIKVIEVGPSGNVIVAGTFTQIGGVAANNIAFWDGSNWNAMGTGVAADSVNCITFGIDGLVYIGGSFTTIGGVGAARFASWNGSTFAAPQNYTSGAVMCFATHPLTGAIYLGGSMVRGNFTGLDVYQIPGFPYNSYGGTFDPFFAAVSALAVTGGTATVNALAFYGMGTNAGELYIAGDFTAITWSISGTPQTPVSTTRMGKWVFGYTGPAGTTIVGPVAVVVASATQIANDLIASADGKYLYLAGHVVGPVSATSSVNGIVYRYDGTSWVQIAGWLVGGWGPESPVQGVRLRNAPDGSLWMAGKFVAIGTMNTHLAHMLVANGVAGNWTTGQTPFVQNVVRWNGSEWLPVDAMFYGGNGASTGQNQYTSAIAFTNNGEMLMGHFRQPTGLAKAGSYTSISKPITVDAPTPIQILINQGTGLLSRITNWSTGRELMFRNPNMAVYTQTKIDTRIGSQEVSLGDLRNGIDWMGAESALALFWLQAGENKVSMFTPTHGTGTISSTGASAVLYYRERLLSIDAIPRDQV